VGVRETARLVSLKVPTVQQLMKTLQAKNYLEFDTERRQYRIGPAATLLAGGTDIKKKLAEFITPHLADIFEKFGETAAALTLQGDDFYVLDWKQTTHPLAVTMPERGSTVRTPHNMASARILLAWQDEEFINRYMNNIEFPEKEKNTFKSPKTFAEELRKIKKQGYAETENVADSGIAALAVPVFSSAGRLLIAIGCSAPLTRFPKEQREKALSYMLEISLKIKL
jgi:DNA-binding IclR family transcriptional regulator